MAQKLYISNKGSSPQLYKNKILERLSSPHHLEPLIFLSPVFLYFLYKTIFVVNLRFWEVASMWLMSMIFWTVLEYVLHRFLFHLEPKSEWLKKFVYTVHGCHHDYPNDPKKLVAPAVVSVPAALLFYFLFKLILGPSLVIPFMAGLVSTYVIYDLNHYASHYSNWKNPIFQKMKKHHLRHHYKDPEKCFGFTTSFWDRVFKTDLTKEE